MVDNGASARICVDHELLNENVLYRFSCQKSLFFFTERILYYYTKRPVNRGAKTSAGEMDF